MSDREERQSWHYQLSDYEAAQVRDVLEQHDHLSAWLILSRFGNGFVREAALRALVAQPSAEALEALLERLNDWVPQVRQQAAVAVEAYLLPARAELLLQALAPLLALADKQRVDHGQTLARARDVLLAPEVRPQVLAAFVGARGKVARWLLALLLESTREPLALLALALAHDEVTVRQRAVDACAELLPAEARPLLEQAMQTCGASVRVKALRLLWPLLDDPRPALRAALLDRSAALRCLARWAAPQVGLDSREVLLKRLAEPLPRTKDAWLGLVGLARELKAAEADAMLREALGSASLQVRVQALEALGERGLVEQIAALDDPADKVFACALRLLRQQALTDYRDAVEQRLDQHWHELPEPRRQALLSCKPGWRQLQYLLRRHDQAPAEAAHWLEQLNRWCAWQFSLQVPKGQEPQREALLLRVQQMEEAGQLPSGSAKRLR